MYLALYRKYRPTRFDEMVGQEYVRKTLRSQVKTGRISHAYLFCGLRGTGKTTAAKIFAAAINCPNSGADGEPCGVCPTCQMLRSESNLDVIEIDAASNNGVDQIRELRDKVVYPPQHGRYKVYIIDEVHMLTGSAFNAMLKTLEEPPAHAVFILATTEVQKLPATILSRCQRFDFKHISMADIITRMKTVLDDLGAGYDERALSLIASVADGGMRDALSMADMCLSYEGERPCITYENTLEVLGTMDRGFLFDLTDALLRLDAAQTVRALDRVISDGKNVNVFLRELMSHLRDVLLVRVSRGADCRDVVGCSEEVYARLRKQASDASAAALERAIGILADTEIALARFSRPRILLELALLKICRPEDERESVQALETRLGALETTVRSGVVAVSAAQQAAPARTSPAPETAEPSAPTTEPPRVSRDYAGVYAELLKLVRKQKISLLAMLKAANGGELLGERFILEFPSEDEAFCQALMRPQNKSFLEESIKTITGKSYDLTCRVGSDAASPIEEVFALLGGGKPELDTAKTSSSYDDLFDEKESYDEFIEPDEYDDGRTEEEENG